MKWTLLFSVLLFAALINPSQSQTRFKQDTAWKRLSEMKDDTVKVMALFSKSLETSVNDIDLSGFYALKTHELAQKLNYTKGIIYSCDVLGNNYLQKGSYEKAYQWMSKSIKLKEKKGDPFDLAIGYNQLAVLFRTMENYAVAKKYSHKSLQQSKILKSEKFIGLSTSTLSNIFHENNEYDSALYYNEQALTLHRKANDSSSIALSLTNQGVILNKLKKFDLAIERNLEAKNFINTSEYRLLLICESNLGSSYLAKNDLANAQIAIENALRISKDFAESDQLMLVYKLNAELQYKKGNFREAYDYRIKYQELSDSIDDAEIRKDIAGLETKYETAKKEKENQELKFQNEINQKELEENERKSFQLKLIIAGSGLILIMLIFIIVNRYRSAKKLAEQNEQINKQNLTLKTLNSELIESEEKLQASDSAKSELLSIISHDISSPVNSLYQFQQALLDKIEVLSKEELGQNFSRIHQHTKEIHQLVNNLLDYSFTQQHGFTKNITEVDLKKLVAECVSLFRESITSKNLSIDLSNIENVIIKTDINLLRLVIRNLLSNAIKFSPQQKTIVFSYVNGVLQITNPGNPLPIGLIQELKKGTNQDSERGTANERGTGLGMKIVRNAALLLGSELLIHSDQNGNHFGIRI